MTYVLSSLSIEKNASQRRPAVPASVALKPNGAKRDR